MFPQSHCQMRASYYKQPLNHRAAHSTMTIMLYRLYPQATPEQKPPGRIENVSPQLICCWGKKPSGASVSSVHMAESVANVVMSLADVGPIETFPKPAFPLSNPEICTAL